MYRHLLIPLDGSAASERAVRCGVRLARGFAAKITALHVEPPRTDAGDAHGRAILDYARRVAHAAHVACTTASATAERPADAIVAQANRAGCDLIVMASHRRGAMEAVFLGSHTQRVISTSNLPVLVVGRDEGVRTAEPAARADAEPWT